MGVPGLAVRGEGGGQEDPIGSSTAFEVLGAPKDGPAKTLEKLQREAKKRWKAEEGAAKPF